MVWASRILSSRCTKELDGRLQRAAIGAASQFIFVHPSHIQHDHIRLFARRLWSVINQFGAEIPFRLHAGSESIAPSYELLFWVLYHSFATALAIASFFTQDRFVTHSMRRTLTLPVSVYWRNSLAKPSSLGCDRITCALNHSHNNIAHRVVAGL